MEKEIQLDGNGNRIRYSLFQSDGQISDISLLICDELKKIGLHCGFPWSEADGAIVW